MEGEPTGYDVHFKKGTSKGDCTITVGFDQDASNCIIRFMVELRYLENPRPMIWQFIARFDHNSVDDTGHDVYNEGLHIDVKIEGGRELTIYPSYDTLPSKTGVVLRTCIEYFSDHVEYFFKVFKGEISPNNPPSWPL